MAGGSLWGLRYQELTVTVDNRCLSDRDLNTVSSWLQPGSIVDDIHRVSQKEEPNIQECGCTGVNKIFYCEVRGVEINVRIVESQLHSEVIQH